MLQFEHICVSVCGMLCLNAASSCGCDGLCECVFVCLCVGAVCGSHYESPLSTICVRDGDCKRVCVCVFPEVSLIYGGL